MGNLCSIFHAHFDKLVSLTQNHNKAIFLDKCIFWWQISKYTLTDEKIWFTRPLSDMAKELSMSVRTISRYLEEMEEKGLLERTCKLSSSNKNDTFSVTKRLYIRVTDKLLNLLQLTPKESKPIDKTNETCSFSNQLGVIEKANLAVSIYKDKDHNQINNNTVSQDCSVNNFEKPSFLTPKITTNSKQSVFPIEETLGEQIDERLKNYIKGMLINVQKQHDLHFSDPNKLFAEIVFSVTQDVQWQGVSNTHHRVNIIAKLLRHKQWRTPKGFYNHWDIGQFFRKKEQRNLLKAQQEKKSDIHFTSNEEPPHVPSGVLDSITPFDIRINDEYRYSKPKTYEEQGELKKLNQSLQQIILSIRSESTYLKELNRWFEQKNPCINKTLIDSVEKKLTMLHEEKKQLQDMIHATERKVA